MISKPVCRPNPVDAPAETFKYIFLILSYPELKETSDKSLHRIQFRLYTHEDMTNGADIYKPLHTHLRLNTESIRFKCFAYG